MEVIVASEPMDYEIRGMYRFATLREGSGLAEAVRDQWPENPRMLMIAAEPENDTYTENLAMDLATAFVKADLPVGELRVLQRETADVAAQLVAGADVIVLADGVRPSLASWTCRPCLRASRRALSLSRFPRRRATPSDSPAAG